MNDDQFSSFVDSRVTEIIRLSKQFGAAELLAHQMDGDYSFKFTVPAKDSIKNYQYLLTSAEKEFRNRFGATNENTDKRDYFNSADSRLSEIIFTAKQLGASELLARQTEGDNSFRFEVSPQEALNNYQKDIAAAKNELYAHLGVQNQNSNKDNLYNGRHAYIDYHYYKESLKNNPDDIESFLADYEKDTMRTLNEATVAWLVGTKIGEDAAERAFKTLNDESLKNIVNASHQELQSEGKINVAWDYLSKDDNEKLLKSIYKKHFREYYTPTARDLEDFHDTVCSAASFQLIHLWAIKQYGNPLVADNTTTTDKAMADLFPNNKNTNNKKSQKTNTKSNGLSL